MLETVVILYSIFVLMRLYISVMQIGYINQEKRKEPILMSSAKYMVSANYAVAKEKLSLVETFVDYLMFLWWVIAGFAWIESIIHFDSTITQSVAFLFGFIIINFIVGLPFELYMKFKIDEDFKFNKMTPKDYIIDTLKSSLLFIILGGAIFYLLSWIISSYEAWWLWGFGIMFVVVLGANIVYPIFIAPIFNKFTPLEDGELKTAIIDMMESVGLKSDGIFSMDASKKDSRLNAYFAGVGKSKRVVLFDTLIEKLTKDELLAVLGHELGHFKHGDIFKNLGLISILLFITFFLAGNIPDELFTQIGVIPSAGAKIAILMLLMPIISFIFTPIMSFVSRHNEYEADEFGANLGGKENLASALLKLVTENKSFPKSHPLVIFFYYTHPPVIERLKELGYEDKAIVS
ncbi:Putative integral membrane zinc-metalloprotease [hydrothermal vent metagenome]|uniref:Putative integral membrane zinc-metalloprotease n=1 Tax=hydrothermal vent metagenome TaxID=652676 RepID=A0A1W1EHP6_9ZZZZ